MKSKFSELDQLIQLSLFAKYLFFSLLLYLSLLETMEPEPPCDLRAHNVHTAIPDDILWQFLDRLASQIDARVINLYIYLQGNKSRRLHTTVAFFRLNDVNKHLAFLLRFNQYKPWFVWTCPQGRQIKERLNFSTSRRSCEDYDCLIRLCKPKTGAP